MSLASEEFVRVVPVSLNPIFQLMALPEAGAEVWLENLSDGNSITYKFQDSDDGVEWADKPLETASVGVTAATFVLPSGAQVVHLSRRKAHVRMLAAAPTGTSLAVRVSWASLDSAPVKYLTA